MTSKYAVFCRVVACGSFTKAAEQLSYSQSAVSQTIKTLERELGTTLLARSKDGVTLTRDGETLYPYLQALWRDEQALARRTLELQGLTNSTIRIGTFTSVSRNLLPGKMKVFKARYPGVQFVLQQGEYNMIRGWVLDGSVDFGFVNLDAVPDLSGRMLYQDRMLAVLPEHHPLAVFPELNAAQLAAEPFVLLDEGNYSVPLQMFSHAHLTPRIEYKVYDDYSILAMVRQNLGISMMYERVLDGFETGLALRPVRDAPRRRIALVWNNWQTMPLAAREFASLIMGESPTS